MKRALLVFSLCVGATSASADVISDESCKPWEHWEGAHDGGCRFACTAAPLPQEHSNAPLMIAGLVLGVALRRGKR